MDRRFSIFSGMELNVSKGRGLNGACDFVFTKGENQHLREAPIVGILEAKNEDSYRQGLGQCVAAMFAAWMRNQQAGWSVTTVFGALTTGRAWQFLRLEGASLTRDPKPYSLHDMLTLDPTTCRLKNLSQVMGILECQIERALTCT
jgi:hypothetical protein